MKKYIVITSVFVSLFLCACNDNTEVSYSMADLVSDFKVEKSEVVIGQEVAFKVYLPGIQPIDKILLRKDGVNMYMNWSYPEILDAAEGELNYDPEHVFITTSRTDEWSVGEWDLIVRRDKEEDNVGKINCVLLADKEIDVDTYADLLNIKASGWSGQSVDSLVFVSQDFRQVKVATGADDEKLPAVIQNLKIQLPKDFLSDGTWKLFIERWEFGLKEELTTFEFIKKGFLDDAPITADADGKYKVFFKLDQVKEKEDKISIISPITTKKETRTLSNEFFDPDTHIYTLVLDEVKTPANEGKWRFTMRRSGIYVFQAIEKELTKAIK